MEPLDCKKRAGGLCWQTVFSLVKADIISDSEDCERFCCFRQLDLIPAL